MAKLCPSYPIVVAAVDPHSLCFTSPGVKRALESPTRWGQGGHWLMSFVRSEMESAAAGEFPAPCHHRASVRRPRLWDALRRCRWQVGLQSLTAPAVSFLTMYKVFKKKKKRTSTSVHSSKPDKLCAAVFAEMLSRCIRCELNLELVCEGCASGIWKLIFNQMFITAWQPTCWTYFPPHHSW